MASMRAAGGRCSAPGTAACVRWTSFSGRFADAHIESLGDHDLADFEALMEVPDDELYTWIVGRVPAVRKFRTRIFDSIVAFHARDQHQG